MEIRKYHKDRDEEKLINLLKEEGGEWSCYFDDNVIENYKESLEKSITYVAYQDGVLCGYSRSVDDYGFYIYVCDLLVNKKYRGNNIGRRLMECIYLDFPGRTVYVMSDVDGYYGKLGYRREGSIFEVTYNKG